MNVGELRKILANKDIPDDAEVRVEVCTPKEVLHQWGVAYDARWYGEDRAFWVEGRYP